MAWYALYTKSRHEKRVHATLMERQLEAYLPLKKELRQWKDRRKWVEEPLFKCYVFVNMHLQDRLKALQVSGAVKLIAFGGKPVTVPDWQIEQLKRIMENSDNAASVELEDFLKVGDPVEIAHGPLEGVRGYLIEKRGQSRLTVILEGIYQSASFVVDRKNVRKINEL